LRDRYGNIVAERKTDWMQSLADFHHDVLIVGHTHQVYAEQLGRVLVINPGSVPFNHSCMVLSLPDLRVETYALGDREITHCWNFSMQQG
jgi:putative phosphoesterase